MYSLRSKALLNMPQAAIESDACGSRIVISRRALGCAIGTNSAPAGTSTVADAQQILVLDHGRIVERGTHPQLLAAGGLYAQMWQRQQASQSEEEEAESQGEPGELSLAK